MSYYTIKFKTAEGTVAPYDVRISNAEWHSSFNQYLYELLSRGLMQQGPTTISMPTDHDYETDIYWGTFWSPHSILGFDVLEHQRVEGFPSSNPTTLPAGGGLTIPGRIAIPQIQPVFSLYLDDYVDGILIIAPSDLPDRKEINQYFEFKRNA